MKRIAIAVTIVSLMLTSASAEAQVNYGVAAGVSTPFGNFSKLAERGYQLTGLIAYMPPPAEFPELAPLMNVSQLGVRGDVSFSKFTYRNTIGSTNASAQILSATVDAVSENPRVTGLYMLYGVGIYHAASVCSGCTTRSTRPGVNLGAEYKLRVGAVNAFLELRYHYIPGAMDPTTGGAKGATGFMPMSFALKF